MTVPAPTLGQEAQLAQAIIADATRQLLLAPAALGLSGEVTEFGVASVRPPYGIDEVLYGLRTNPEWEVEDLAGLVTADDVIRAGLMVDPATFPTDRLADVQRAIVSASEWVRNRVWGAHGVA